MALTISGVKRKDRNTVEVSEFPDATNTGPEAAGYTSLTTWPNSYSINTSNQTITGYRFTEEPVINGSNITFRGCEFKRSSVDWFVCRLNATNTTFEDCRWRPLGTDTVPVSRTDSYQQGIKMFAGSAGLTVRRCEFWGFGNAIEFDPDSSTQTNPIRVYDSYFHDAADQGDNIYHHDGILSSYSSQWVTLDHNTIVSGGNTNAIAFQTTTGAPKWADLTITNNLVSGFGYTVNLGDDVGCNNVVFTGNVYSTMFDPDWGPFKNNWAAFTGTNVWSNNRWRVPAGAEYGDPSWDGKYWWPTDLKNTGGHVTDYAG